jgi:hypothetical protein
MDASDDPLAALVFDAVAVRALGQVLEAAAVAQARVAPIKGIVLSRTLYARIEDRPYRDVDLLIARDGLARMREQVALRQWPIRHHFDEMGELEFTLGRLTFEIHAEFGRRDLSRLSTAEVIDRARIREDLLPYPFRCLDDIDHFLLLVANVTKKSFVYANEQHPSDLERLLATFEGRQRELHHRIRQAAMVTAVQNVADWMVDVHASRGFARLRAELPSRNRPMFRAAMRAYRRRATKQPRRLASASGLTGLTLAVLSPDAPALRLRGLSRLVRRGLIRRLGRNPG